MPLEIQGVNYKLSDPEIATLPEKDGNFEERLFCSGNLGEVPIEEFIKGHKCSKFCDLAGLARLRNSSSLDEQSFIFSVLSLLSVLTVTSDLKNFNLRIINMWPGKADGMTRWQGMP